MSTLRSCSSQKKFGCIRGGLDGSAVLIVTYPRLFGQTSCGSTERYPMIFRIPSSTPTSLGIVCWGSRNNMSRAPDLILVWKL